MLVPKGGAFPVGGGSSQGSNGASDGFVIVERSSFAAIGKESQVIRHQEFLVEADRDFTFEGGLLTKIDATGVEERAVKTASDASVELLDLLEGRAGGGQVECCEPVAEIHEIGP